MAHTGTIIRASEEQLVVAADRLQHLVVIDRAGAIAVPSQPDLAPGDAVKVVRHGRIRDGYADRTDGERGMVTVTYRIVHADHTERFPYGTVWKEDKR